jgi:hypothetical protein
MQRLGLVDHRLQRDLVCDELVVNNGGESRIGSLDSALFGAGYSPKRFTLLVGYGQNNSDLRPRCRFRAAVTRACPSLPWGLKTRTDGTPEIHLAYWRRRVTSVTSTS